MMRVIKAIASVLCLCAAVQAAEGTLEQGIAAYNEGRYSEASTLLVQAGDGERARVYLAVTQAARNQCTEALPVLTTEMKSSDAELSRLSGLSAVRCKASSGQIGQALGIAEQLKQRFPENADVLYVAAETEMKAFNDTTFAMFQRTPSSYRVHELSARIFEVQNRFGDAVSEYRKAIELNPSAPDLHFRLGRAILLESHSNEALQSAAAMFDEELKISPEDSGCEYQLGQIAQVQGQAADAQKHFQRALQLSPEFAGAMVALAASYSHEGQYPRAIELLVKAVKLQPDNEAAHYALMTAYRNSGEMDRAKEQKTILDRLQKPPEGEFTDFLKKLGDGQKAQ